MLRNARVVGMATARVAEANRELVVRNLTSPGDNERDLADRLVGTAEFLLPLGTEFLDYAFQANLLELIKRDVIGAADLAAGDIGGVVERTVCFADLVEFTSLGEEIAPEELGAVVGHFEELATSIVAAAGAPGEDDRRRGDAGLGRGRAAGRRSPSTSSPPRPPKATSSRSSAPASPPARPCPNPATTTAARSTWRAASPASPAPAASSSTPPPARPPARPASPTPSPASAA